MVELSELIQVHTLEDFLNYFEWTIFEYLFSVKVNDRDEGLFDDLKRAIFLDFVPDENADRKRDNSHKEAQQGFGWNQFNDGPEMQKLVFIIKFSTNFDKQGLLDNSEVVNEVLLQKVGLSKQPR